MVYPDTTKDFGRLIEETNGTLYDAKHSGRNRVVLRI
ncbi:MAG: hypothetical protein GX136_06315 [Clostridiales bacterium]|nr:hypothetical protein [Clostridiales bacterium]